MSKKELCQEKSPTNHLNQERMSDVKFELYSTYLFTAIENYASKNDMELLEYGSEIIGESFIVVKDDNRILSFVMIAHNATYGAFYRLIFAE
jgi:hypothetical protein